MDYVHRCVLCGWERPARSSTVTSPRCEHCGCALAAVAASGTIAADRLHAIQLPEELRGVLTRLAAAIGAALFMIASARLGYSEGGPATAVAAVGMAGLAVTLALCAERR